MLDIAVLGAGRIGRIHAGNIAAHPGARLAGIADPDATAANQVATALGVRPISVAEAMRADAVLIASPTPTHADYVEQAAAAGRAVFCEKPIDLSEQRVRRCLAAVRSAGIILMTGFNRRFDPHFVTLKRRLDAGEIGALELLTIISRDPSPPPPAYVATSGGLFRDMMIHDLDMARFLLG
jgi:myo-inositol 2-dehydrogenase / D-chiro-inositol 1-dehydrogenase